MGRRKRGRRDGLFQRNGWWWIDYYDAEGKRHRKKAAPDYQTAKLRYRNTMTAIAKGEALGVREEGTRLGDFFERIYWPTIAPTIAPLWAKLSLGSVHRTILPRFGSLKLLAIRQDDIERWYGERVTRVKPSTANKELGRLKHLLGRAVAWKYLKHNPAQPVRKMKENPGRVRYLTPEERELLLREANPALRLYILAALQTGARRSELVRLRWADVDLKRRLITFPKTKNGDRRAVPLNDSLAVALAVLPRGLDPETRVFPERDPHVVSRSFARLVRRLGLRDLHFHDLRHDAASTLTMGGVSQRTVMEILGHRDPRMTLRYQHLAPEYLKEAMRTLERASASALRAEAR
ncbi:MAG TPA: site-specific integrase [Methylomirabilota bacterium]|nr:site-specific integrase [Methylomirabilota bacterium]